MAMPISPEIHRQAAFGLCNSDNSESPVAGSDAGDLYVFRTPWQAIDSIVAREGLSIRLTGECAD